MKILLVKNYKHKVLTNKIKSFYSTKYKTLQNYNHMLLDYKFINTNKNSYNQL